LDDYLSDNRRKSLYCSLTQHEQSLTAGPYSGALSWLKAKYSWL
jgi:hypothetical protein